MTQLKNGAKKYVSPMYTPVIGPIKTGYDAYSTLLSVEKSPLRKMPPMVGHLVFTAQSKARRQSTVTLEGMASSEHRGLCAADFALCHYR